MSLENCIERLSKTYGRQSYSCSLTAFCASKALAINIHLIYPPVHGLADPQVRFPDYYEGSLSSNKNPRLITPKHALYFIFLSFPFLKTF